MTVGRKTVIGMAAMLCGGLATPALAHHDAVRSVTFTAAFRDPGTQVTGLDHCDPAQPGVCSFSFSGTAAFTAPMQAVDTYYGHLSYDPTTMSVAGESWDRQTGSLAGCGTGSFVMHQTEFRSSPTLYDASARAARLTLKWTVVPNSGTGAFAGATGFGTGYADFEAPTDPMYMPGIPNSGVYTGTVTCPASQPGTRRGSPHAR
jgi:hypothetical protein